MCYMIILIRDITYADSQGFHNIPENQVYYGISTDATTDHKNKQKTNKKRKLDIQFHTCVTLSTVNKMPVDILSL